MERVYVLFILKMKNSKIEELQFNIGQRKKLKEELKEIDKDIAFIRKVLKTFY